MFNKGQLAGLMKQAQAMQDNMKKAQDELATIEVTGESGAGLVKVVMTCKHDVRRVTIDPSLLADDKDMLEAEGEKLRRRQDFVHGMSGHGGFLFPWGFSVRAVCALPLHALRLGRPGQGARTVQAWL